jgi:hypothetical protein
VRRRSVENLRLRANSHFGHLILWNAVLLSEVLPENEHSY